MPFKKIVSIGLLLCCVVFFSAAIKAQPSAMQAAFKQAADSGFSGVVLVAKKDKIIFEGVQGYRHFETKEPLQSTDIFELASLSKQFTAMVIMMLQEDGLLQYDDLIEKYVQVPYKGISIRHLLTHTSGLPDYQQVMDLYWDKTKVAGNADAIEYLNKYVPPMLFAPGEKYSYSNTGYLLLASIAEQASGKDFIALARSRIFKKLKMKSTDIRTLEEKAATLNFAAGHLKDSMGQYVNANKFHSSDYTVWLGNRKGPGRVSSNAQDLLKWDRALYTKKLVKTETLQLAFSPAKLNNGTSSDYGFGWVIQHDAVLGKLVMHTGDNPGYATRIFRYIDKRYTVIILCNNAHASMRSLVDATTIALQNL